MKTLLILPPALALAFALGTSTAGTSVPGIFKVQAQTLLHAAQDTTEVEPTDQDEFPPGWRGEQLRREAQLREQLIGHWQLIEFRHASNNLAGTQVAGFMSIDPEVLTIVLHAALSEPGPFQEPLQLQGGAHYWRIDENQRIQTASILSHSTFNGRPEIERSLTPREYEPTLAETELTLRRGDGSQLIFLRVPGLAFPDAAIAIMDAVKAGRDPFGR